jgi:hypothetical protein
MDKSQWQISNRFIAMLAIAIGLGFFAMLLLAMLSGKTKGNEQAMNFWRYELKEWKNSSNKGNQFIFISLPPEVRHRSIAFGDYFNAWFQTNFFWTASSNREIVIVCGREFNNVPKSSWTFFLKYPAHTVGYSDGTVGLISPEEFTNLNLNGFISAANLITNLDWNTVK